MYIIRPNSYCNSQTCYSVPTKYGENWLRNCLERSLVLLSLLTTEVAFFYFSFKCLKYDMLMNKQDELKIKLVMYIKHNINLLEYQCKNNPYVYFLLLMFLCLYNVHFDINLRRGECLLQFAKYYMFGKEI